ncbi:MAG: hypothetical protein HY835_13685 [Anaerolineae bacterium]|nr:hypothetical protein [Anaerolineae bacterium]
MNDTATTTHFSSTYPILVYTRPAGTTGDWQEFDQGPGYFHIPEGQEVMVRLRTIDNATLRKIVTELAECPALVFLNLSENRNVTGDGLEYVTALKSLTGLNLSSCSLTDTDLVHLTAIPKLAHLDLSYCNRLTDASFKHIRQLSRLRFLDLQGCIKITNGGIARLRIRDLKIHR